MGGEKIDSILRKLYYSPNSKGALGGIDRLHRTVKNKFTRKEIYDWLRTQDVYTLHKPVRYRFTRNRTLVSHIDDVWQLDLVDMQAYKNDNNQYKYLLTCIDVFSKYAWAVPLKDKKSSTILEAIKVILSGGRKPKKIQTDAGGEFLSGNTKTYLQSQSIGMYTTNNETKASVVERFNRTLKSRMWRHFTHKGKYQYLDIIDDLVNGYNNSYHRSIKMAPTEVSDNNSKEVHKNLFPPLKKTHGLLKVNDKVRITKLRKSFVKGYLPNWTDEVFTIASKVSKHPNPVYTLIDANQELIKGTFYDQELQKIYKTDEDLWRIDKIVEERGRGKNRKLLVKWRGYSDLHNSWIKASDLIQLDNGGT